MSSTTTAAIPTVTVSLRTAGDLVEVVSAGVVIGSVMDGARLIARTDRVLADHQIRRSTGYNVVDGLLAAAARDFS
jgi:hypothetical protein